ncbi:MAG: ABC transporter ATP-binding protein [Capsulimonadaceae bacterium]
MILLEGASRWYGQVLGLYDVSCAIGPGITALLGSNGAGKSTMLKLITGQLRPTRGRVTVLGEMPFANPNVYKRLGYCPEIENCYDELTGLEFVTFLGGMSGLNGAILKERVGAAIDRAGMTANAGRKIGGYSKGMRQRIKLAQCIVHDPDILILDEPLNGLDPLGRREMSQLLTQFAGAGKCIVVSSHILHEVEQLTRNILLIHTGRLVAQGDIYHIRGLIDAHPHRIAITSAQARAIAKGLLDLPFVLSVRFDSTNDRFVEVETRAPGLFYAQFPDIVLQHGFVIDRFDSPDNNLEAVFRYLVQG